LREDFHKVAFLFSWATVARTKQSGKSILLIVQIDGMDITRELR